MTAFGLCALFIGGIAAGIGNTLVGGGSLISLPLLLVLGLDPAAAIGTNRFAVTFLAASGAISYRRQNAFTFRESLPLVVAMGAGAVLGAAITVSLPDRVLATIVLVVLYSFGGMLFIDPGRTVGEGVLSGFRKPPVKFGLIFMLGVYGGFIGVAVTTMTVVFLKRVEGRGLLNALAINQAAVCALSAIASIVFFAHGAISIVPGAYLAAGMALGGLAGPGLAQRLGEDRLDRILKLTVLVLAVRATYEWFVAGS